LRPTVLLADDDPAILALIQNLIDGEFLVVGAFLSGEEVLRAHAKLNPEVIVLDISMPSISGFEVARRLRQQGCNTRIVFITLHEQPEFISTALALGALGYVIKSRAGSDLVPAIRAALSGQVFVSSHNNLSQ